MAPFGDKTTTDSKNALMGDPRTVFVVHGRNRDIRDSMFAFLRAIGLKPLEWSQAVHETGKASPYIGEILDKAFSIARAVVVLMTPDDEAYLKKEFHSEHEPSHETELTPQARPNVLFEAGMAMGRDADRTLLVEIGRLRPFSDVAGRHVIRLSNRTQDRQDIAKRLERAGCAVELNGTDWHTVGSFELVDKSNSSIPKANLRPINPGLTSEELEIISTTQDIGSIHVARSDCYGRSIMHHERKFFDVADASIGVKYLEALEMLVDKGLVRLESMDHYRLTGLGFDLKKQLKTKGDSVPQRSI